MQELKHYRTLPPPPQNKKKKHRFQAKNTNSGGKKATMEHSETEREAHCVSHSLQNGKSTLGGLFLIFKGTQGGDTQSLCTINKMAIFQEL